MINLNEIVNSFTEDKQQEFINYLESKNKIPNAKNVQLFKLLRNENLNSKEISLRLYKKNQINALHALRKRLFQSLIDFTANTNLKEDNSIDMNLIKYILSARTFLQKGHYEVGFKVLEKAEGIANEYQLHTILNEIYHTKIEYAHCVSSINLENIINTFRENQKQFEIEENLNIAYAQIRKEVNEIQYNQKVVDIKSVIDKVLNVNKITFSDSLSFKSLYQIIQITNISTSQNFKYCNIEPFLLETYQILKNHKAKEKQLFYHIEVLYVIANTLFRNKKFANSLQYLELMNYYMHQNKKKYFKEFHFKYQVLFALNHNYIGNQDFAISILLPFVDKKNIDLVSELDIYLSLIVFYFQKNELDKAKRIFSKFYHTDKWYIEKAGIIWTIKKNILEVLLQIDLGNTDVVESRLLSFKRNYFEMLKKINQDKVIMYIKLVEAYYKNPEKVTSKEFFEKVENSFQWKTHQKEDIFMMSFFAWLKAKMTKKDIYEVTLNLINQ